ncbi:AraC family transcriptional regulator [Pseudomonas sp. zfem002]|uniref:AraC-like transcriptional regulator QhpR n=1 Tax=Pseudomonas sp. zfem002 TaxID=3078197 RepID=UPI00292801C9|nr:AraC family transcriptional regulator ligand-binding domain-containing protein [Pseudomonas sp. zfem002]MDU9390213.1 AraC family transcriptional regulator ligand-binding domain-containing protein [Pseudomonas sp. zfem002]
MASSIRGTALLGFDEFAFTQGLDSRALLADFSLAAVSPDDPLDTRRFNDLLELCAQRSGNPLFGLEFGLQHGLRGLGNLGPLAANASTVGEVLEALSQPNHGYGSAVEFHLERHADPARLSFQVIDADIPRVRQAVELAAGMTAQLMQHLGKQHWHPSGLLLRHTGGGVDLAAYRRLLGVTPRFASLENAWLFDPALLGLRLVERDERTTQWMRQLQEELSDIELHELPAYVQKLIRGRMLHGRVTLEQIATDLTISPRTLQRYLMTEGTSFQALLDDTRQALATRFMRDSAISLTRLAELLGYAQLGAFSRAFSRWHGVSPQQWKRQLQCEPLARQEGQSAEPSPPCP